MSASILMHPNADDPEVIWPGSVKVNTEGAALARELLIQLGEISNDYDVPSASDLAQLKNWPRRGQPYQNTVAEYLSRAQAAGPSVTEGFCAILGDYLSDCLTGSVPYVRKYDQYAGILEEQTDD